VEVLLVSKRREKKEAMRGGVEKEGRVKGGKKECKTASTSISTMTYDQPQTTKWMS
jgi:hypothetical protein